MRLFCGFAVGVSVLIVFAFELWLGWCGLGYCAGLVAGFVIGLGWRLRFACFGLVFVCG